MQEDNENTDSDEGDLHIDEGNIEDEVFQSETTNLKLAFDPLSIEVEVKKEKDDNEHLVEFTVEEDTDKVNKNTKNLIRIEKEITDAKATSIGAEPYFSFFKSLELDFSELTKTQQVLFKKACEATLIQLLKQQNQTKMMSARIRRVQ